MQRWNTNPNPSLDARPEKKKWFDSVNPVASPDRHHGLQRCLSSAHSTTSTKGPNLPNLWSNTSISAAQGNKLLLLPEPFRRHHKRTVEICQSPSGELLPGRRQCFICDQVSGYRRGCYSWHLWKITQRNEVSQVYLCIYLSERLMFGSWTV